MQKNEIEIEKIKIGERYRKEKGDIDQLAKSINEVGLIHPIVLNEKNELIAGFRRLEALKQIGIKKMKLNEHFLIQKRVKGKLKQIQENVVRKDFTPEEAYKIWMDIDGHQGKKLGANSEQSKKPIKQAEEITGYSHTTLTLIGKVIKSGDNGIIEAMNKGKKNGGISVNQAHYKVTRKDNKSTYIYPIIISSKRLLDYYKDDTQTQSKIKNLSKEQIKAIGEKITKSNEYKSLVSQNVKELLELSKF